MKFAIVLALFSLSSFANVPVIDVTCTDADTDLRDAGFSLSIISGGFAGLTHATVTEQTIAGPRVVGAYMVTYEDQSTFRFYNSKYHALEFELVISLESLMPTNIHPAGLRFKRNLGRNKGMAEADLLCTFNRD